VRAVRVNADTADRGIDVLVAHLRRKLQEQPEAPQVIETVRAMGYSFNATVEIF
jgi:two-component system, OmpR family, response regulator